MDIFTVNTIFRRGVMRATRGRPRVADLSEVQLLVHAVRFLCLQTNEFTINVMKLSLFTLLQLYLARSTPLYLIT